MGTGLITTAQHLLETGDERRLSKRFSSGELVRIRQGIYYPTGSWARATVWERYRVSIEAVAMAFADPVFCLATAAHLWGYPLITPPTEITVAVATRNLSRTAATRVALSAEGRRLFPTAAAGTGFATRSTVLAAERASKDGLSLTGRAQTVVHCAARLDFKIAVAIMDTARRPGGHRWIGDREIHAAVAALPSAARRRRARSIIEFSTGQSESPGESLSRSVIHLLGFEVPSLQFPLVDGRGYFGRADFYWQGLRLVGEFDGAGKYNRGEFSRGLQPGEIVRLEKKREDRIRRMGIDVVRWGWEEAKNPELLEELLLEKRVPRVGW